MEPYSSSLENGIRLTNLCEHQVPGYYVMEGNIMFGAKVVEPNAIIKLVEEISA